MLIGVEIIKEKNWKKNHFFFISRCFSYKKDPSHGIFYWLATHLVHYANNFIYIIEENEYRPFEQEMDEYLDKVDRNRARLPGSLGQQILRCFCIRGEYHINGGFEKLQKSCKISLRIRC